VKELEQLDRCLGCHDVLLKVESYVNPRIFLR